MKRHLKSKIKVLLRCHDANFAKGQIDDTYDGIIDIMLAAVDLKQVIGLIQQAQ